MFSLSVPAAENILNAHFARMLSHFNLPLSFSKMQVALVSDLQQVLQKLLSTTDQQNTGSLEDYRIFLVNQNLDEDLHQYCCDLVCHNCSEI